MKKHIEIPPDVVDENEYVKMIALKNHPIMRETIFIASDGTEVNIAMLPHVLRKKISHLAPKEQEDIMNKRLSWSRMRGKISAAKAKAYGRAGCLGGRKKGTVLARISPFENDIVELLGRLFTVDEVVRIMGEDNHIEISVDDVKDVIRKFAVEIEKKREEFRNKLVDVRLYNKRPRLEELAWLYNKMKYRFIAFNGVDAYNCLLRTLEQIRKESEGDIININGALDINIETAIQEHIQAEVLKTVNLKEIILGRVAARMNYDVKKLVAGLHNSYYAKFIEISGKLDNNAVMKYPSDSAYDFTEIERNAEDDVMDVEYEEVKPEEHSKASSLREMFLQKIRQQKKNQETKTMIFDLSSENENNDDLKSFESRSALGKGRAFDSVLPSRSSKGVRKNEKIDYYNGEKKDNI